VHPIGVFINLCRMKRYLEDVMAVEVTDTAKSKLLELGVGGEKFLRIGVIAGGCSGFTYDALIDDIMESSDQVFFETGELKIVSDQSCSEHLEGLSIDYSDDLVQAGFRLTNRKAVKSCGCGSSFATDDAEAAPAAAGGGCGSGGCGS
jgi:iron-sulfur cluster assembly accessory protein